MRYMPKEDEEISALLYDQVLQFVQSEATDCF